MNGNKKLLTENCKGGENLEEQPMKTWKKRFELRVYIRCKIFPCDMVEDMRHGLTAIEADIRNNARRFR